MAKLYTFDSGLKLLYEVNNINKSTSIEIGFDCGARCDGENAGLSHFCEHMFFTGTDKLSKQEVSKRYFDFIRANAYTSNTDIVFNGTIITSKLASYLRCVQDMICNSNFNTIAVEEEKKVVYSTISIQLKIKDEDIKDILREIVDVYFYSIDGLSCEDVISQIMDNRKTKTMVAAEGQVFQMSKYTITRAIGEAVVDGYVVIDDREIDLFPTETTPNYVEALAQTIASYMIPPVKKG